MKKNSLINIQKPLNEIRQREKKNSEFLHLTINENQMSKLAHSFLNSKLSERYYFGGGKDGIVDFVSFTFVGMPEVENLVTDAKHALMEMTGATVANIDCLSGIHAMMCALLSTTEPGDTVMTLNQQDGGHFATKGIIERIGRKHVYASFNLDKLSFNIEETGKIFRKSGAKALYLDVSNHLNPHNLRELRAELGTEAVIIYDASHTLGLILGGKFQNPFAEGADVICANTHKTLAGPQKGLLLFKDLKTGEKANAIVKSYLYSSVHLGSLIALAITILEWKQFGSEYAEQVIKNSRKLGAEFDKLGYELRKSNSGEFSDNEQLHVYIDKIGDYRKLYKQLVDNNISTNVQNVMGNRYFVRIGTQEVTRRGMKESEMRQVAQLVDSALKGQQIKTDVIKFTSRFPSIEYSFDNL